MSAVIFDKRRTLNAADVPKPHTNRWAVLCWATVGAFAHSRPAECVVNVLALTGQAAQDHIRALNAGFEAFEVRLATNDDIEQGMTLSEFRNRYNTR